MPTRTLRSLGYRTSVRWLSFNRYAARVSDSTTRVQIGLWAWQAHCPSASTFLAIPLLNAHSTDLVSSRVRNDQYHPQSGLLLDQVSVR